MAEKVGRHGPCDTPAVVVQVLQQILLRPGHSQREGTRDFMRSTRLARIRSTAASGRPESAESDGYRAYVGRLRLELISPDQGRLMSESVVVTRHSSRSECSSVSGGSSIGPKCQAEVEGEVLSCLPRSHLPNRGRARGATSGRRQERPIVAGGRIACKTPVGCGLSIHGAGEADVSVRCADTVEHKYGGAPLPGRVFPFGESCHIATKKTHVASVSPTCHGVAAPHHVLELGCVIPVAKLNVTQNRGPSMFPVGGG